MRRSRPPGTHVVVVLDEVVVGALVVVVGALVVVVAGVVVVVLVDVVVVLDEVVVGALVVVVLDDVLGGVVVVVGAVVGGGASVVLDDVVLLEEEVVLLDVLLLDVLLLDVLLLGVVVGDGAEVRAGAVVVERRGAFVLCFFLCVGARGAVAVVVERRGADFFAVGRGRVVVERAGAEELVVVGRLRSRFGFLTVPFGTRRRTRLVCWLWCLCSARRAGAVAVRLLLGDALATWWRAWSSVVDVLTVPTVVEPARGFVPVP